MLLKRLSYYSGMAALALVSGAYAADTRTPVIVELFTSEGCSSCPPADDLLSRLAQTQPVANAQIIALEEHVDYWNNLGWSDPFSSAAFSARQSEYASAIKNSDVYTPQVLVNGRAQFVGGDAGTATREVSKAAAMPPLYSFQLQASQKLSIAVKRLADAPSKSSDIFLAITEDGLASKVMRGENGGKTLRHAPVVRKLQKIGILDKRSAAIAEFTAPLELATTWKPGHLHAIVFVQERDSHHITGAAQIDLPPL